MYRFQIKKTLTGFIGVDEVSFSLCFLHLFFLRTQYSHKYTGDQHYRFTCVIVAIQLQVEFGSIQKLATLVR